MLQRNTLIRSAISLRKTCLWLAVFSMGCIALSSVYARPAQAAAQGGVPAAWGYNGYGELGNGTTTDSSVPVAVTTTGALAGKTVVAISAGANHSLALASDGSLYAWGWNPYGQLGNGTTTNSSVPVAVTMTGALSGKTVSAISAGFYHSLALTSDGRVYAWGDNTYGQLANGTTTNSNVPVAVTMSGALSGKTVIAISAGRSHSLALASDGTVYAWGYNVDGQLGNGTTTDSTVPIAVDMSGALAGKTVVAIAAGLYHSLALASDGTVYAWGYNGDGQLGNGTTTNSSVPVAVTETGALSGKTVSAISAGFYHSLALASDGTVYAWGDNGYGQLGNGTTAAYSTVPAAVTISGPLVSRRVLSIAGGGPHSLAIAVTAWGVRDQALGSDDKTRLAWTNADGRLALWTVDSSGTVTNGKSYGPYANWSFQRIAAGTDGLTRLLWTSRDGTAGLWIMSPDNALSTGFTYNPSGGWTAQDIAAGADNKARILWTNTDGRSAIWSIDNSGIVANGVAFAPQGPWTPKRIAAGPDGLSCLLWTNPDGRAALWLLNSDNTVNTGYSFGPAAGWTAQDVGVDSNNEARLLWSNTDGRAALWDVSNTGVITSGQAYGPGSDWSPQNIAGGPSGAGAMVWQRVDGEYALWFLNAGNGVSAGYPFGPL